MEPTHEGSTFLKVDEVGEAPAPADTLAGPSEHGPVDELWAEEVRQEAAAANDSIAASEATGPRPALRRDQWVPPPQQPAPSPPGIMEEPEASTDSISLAQLKKIVMDVPRKEPTPYAFEYKDRSSFEEELEELFGYGVVEREALLQLPLTYEHNCKAFFKEAMQEEPISGDDVEVRHVRYLSGSISSQDPAARKEALQVLLYMALGCWKDTAMQRGSDSTQREGASFEDKVDSRYSKRSVQVYKIKANLALIARVVGFDTISQCFHNVCLRRNAHPSLSNGTSRLTRFDREAMVASNIEFWATSKLLTLLVDFASRCTFIEPNQKLHEDCAKSAPRLLEFLTELLADWRWDDGNTVPPTTLLTMQWKLLLLAFGGTHDVHNIKQRWNQDQDLQRDDTRPFITASPLDYHLFRQEITSKYPAFDPPPPLFPFEPESTSYFPPAQEQIHKMASENKLASSVPGGINATGSSIIHQPVHISTPAPSPPPSPAGPGGKGIKKQNYQTNQMFPFLYPPLEESSNAIGGKGSTELQDALAGRKWTGSHIPASILEAADLFSQRMRATRAMKQLWDERVRFMKYERGYDPLRLPPSSFSDGDAEQQENPEMKPDSALDVLESNQRERLERVDAFYAKEAPNLQSLVVVLLKVMLQAVTTLVTQPAMQNGANGTELPRTQSEGDIVAEHEDQSLSILQNLDLMRVQEIMGKAVSGIILLMLKWFKLSHVLKFEYLTQLLMDSNYSQLTLKMFTYQDLERVVNFKCERKGLNFFEFCHQHALGAKIVPTDDDNDDAEPPPIRTNRNMNGDNLDEVPASVTRVHPPETDELGTSVREQGTETITEYSWRNFFANINHLRIVQKIVKNKVHRQLLMVQLKFSNILKKALKVPQPEIRLYTLKIIKGQVPYCHRKWRQSNMRVITAIYLHCKPELRDDWLAGLAIEEEMSEALPQEQALRSLTYWYNLRTYPDSMGSDKEKASGLMEAEQDFFLRELEIMEAAMGGLNTNDSWDSDDGAMDFSSRADGPSASVIDW